MWKGTEDLVLETMWCRKRWECGRVCSVGRVRTGMTCMVHNEQDYVQHTCIKKTTSSSFTLLPHLKKEVQYLRKGVEAEFLGIRKERKGVVLLLVWPVVLVRLVVWCGVVAGCDSFRDSTCEDYFQPSDRLGFRWMVRYST